MWNVKISEFADSGGAINSINRNIVECKVSCVAYVFETVEVLIETLWNVKYLSKLSSLIVLGVLIETLWNVKELSPFKKLNKDMY